MSDMLSLSVVLDYFYKYGKRPGSLPHGMGARPFSGKQYADYTDFPCSCLSSSLISH